MKKKIILLIIVLLFGWLIGREWWWKGADVIESTVMIAIEEGSSVSSISDQLKDEDIIGSPYLFKVYTKLTGQSGVLQAGEFELYRGMSASDVLEVITNAQANEVSVTFVEGWTLEEMGEYLESQDVTSREEWNSVATHDLEGYLFPDTYRFLKGVSVEDIVSRMREEMDEKISSDMRVELDRNDISIHEILTMASIIEREVRSDDDRKMVSDIFWKRISIGMGLQADSTVNYVTGKDTPSISYEDRDIDSPYNTYKYRGLPPGPISSPSLSSIEAAVYPNSNPYYFFLTDPEGKVYYAKTLEEHGVNRVKYLR